MIMQLIYIILFTATSILMLYNVNMAISLINNTENKFKFNFVLITFVCCALTYILSRFYTYNSPIIDLFILGIYYLGAFIYLLTNNIISIEKCLYVLLLYLCIDSILHSILKFIISLFYYEHIEKNIIIIISLITCIFLFILLKYICTTKKQSKVVNSNSIPKYIYILILLALFFSGGLIESQLGFTNGYVQSIFNKTFTIISIFLLIFIIASLVFNCISKAYFENVSSILEKQVNAQIDYYKKVDKLNNELRNFRHDYKNHMICVQGLLDGQEYDEAREYIHGITLRKTILSKEFASGNTIANAILSDKTERAEKIGAEIQFQGIVFEDIPAADLCTIMANALDNAIEACEKISGDEPKIISVKCSYIKHIQFIWISNPVAEDVRITNNAVETSKADKNIHGIGLYNIRRTVAKYEGEFEISCKDKLFVMDIGFKVN